MSATAEQSDIDLGEARERITQALRGLRFGSVELQVHDGRIVRVTRTEKVRIERFGDDDDAPRRR